MRRRRKAWRIAYRPSAVVSVSAPSSYLPSCASPYRNETGFAVVNGWF